jgi:putative acyl-CoA dehydrogenase
VVVEALECHGGNGFAWQQMPVSSLASCAVCRYVEDSITARLYRQAPLNSIWEGSGNVQCIDILRAMTTHKDAIAAFFGRVRNARGASAQFDVFATRVESRANQMARAVASGADESRHARALADDMAVCLQARNGFMLVAQCMRAHCRRNLDAQRAHRLRY